MQMNLKNMSENNYKSESVADIYQAIKKYRVLKTAVILGSNYLIGYVLNKN